MGQGQDDDGQRSGAVCERRGQVGARERERLRTRVAVVVALGQLFDN